MRPTHKCSRGPSSHGITPSNVPKAPSTHDNKPDSQMLQRLHPHMVCCSQMSQQKKVLPQKVNEEKSSKPNNFTRFAQERLMYTET